MSYESELTIYVTAEPLIRLTNPGDADAVAVNSTKVAQVLKFVIGDFHRAAGITVTEADIISTNLYLEPALNRGLFHLQKTGGKIGPVQDDKATMEEIRLVTHSNRLSPAVGTFEDVGGLFAQEEDAYFPDSVLRRNGFPDPPIIERY